jgi:hypothetical protein
MASIISTKTSGGGGIAVTGDTSGVLQLQSANGTTAVTIDASQNVGIGTGSPSSKLTVANSNVTVNAGYGIAFTGDQDRIMTPEDNVSGALIKWASVGICRFLAANTERMRIDSSGNLLVGTTDTGALSRGIVVRGGISNSYLSVGHVAGTGSGNWYANFDFSGTNIGAIAQNGTTAVSYNTTSDYRLKENIAPMIGALDTVAALKPVTYKWKADGSDGQGFIAHELQEVVPDCVTGEKDAVDAEGNPVYQGIDTSFLVATLTAAIQEQQAIITDLKARIEVLEGASA